MQKIINIEGMSCNHCKNHVETALNAIAGVSAVVDLEKKQATVTMDAPISDDVLKNAVTEAGYEVTGIQ